jgi:hypothetical protein
VRVDGSDEVILTGSFAGYINFGGDDLPGSNADDIFLARFDSSGEHLRSTRFGGIGADNAQAMGIDDADNVLVAGWFENDVDFGGGQLSAVEKNAVVFMYNPENEHVFDSDFGGDEPEYGCRGWAVGADGEGNVVVGGVFFGEVDFGEGAVTDNGSRDIFVVKIEP